MSDYVSNLSLHEVVEKIIHAKHPVLTTHAKPDGDAYGSVTALSGLMRLCGIEPTIYLMPPVPPHFSGLMGYDWHVIYEGQSLPPETDLVVITDTGAWAQIAPIREALTPFLDKTLIIDHHLSGDVEAKWQLIDGGAAACCETIAVIIDTAELFFKDRSSRFNDRAPEELKIIHQTIDQCLFVGIASDTGWFRFSNTKSQTHQLAGKLIDRGVNHDRLIEILEQSDRKEKILLMERALQNIQWIADGKAVVIPLGPEDFEATGALPEETEKIVDIPRNVANVQVVALLTQAPVSNGQSPLVKMSFRSKHGENAINVADLAALLGGGGHARAAGARLSGPLSEITDKVSALIESCLKEHIDRK